MMPEDIDTENIVAKFENGVLDLTIAIKEPEKPKEITINIA
jgi:HSP20 family molecular chaperone IbpA